MVSETVVEREATRIEVRIPVREWPAVGGHAAALEGELRVPAQARGLVLFAHGSGSSRFSPRNRHVAAQMRDAGLATLLFDLLTADEEAFDARNGRLRFDIEFLAARLISVANWVATAPETRDLDLGLFGASTGAAAALVAAARLGPRVCAVVSRGGRPDLAGKALEHVGAPTLLIVGGQDDRVLELNESALSHLKCERRLVIIPGATHLFEETGTLDRAAAAASEWFRHHLGPQPAAG